MAFSLALPVYDARSPLRLMHQAEQAARELESFYKSCHSSSLYHVDYSRSISESSGQPS